MARKKTSKRKTHVTNPEDEEERSRRKKLRKRLRGTKVDFTKAKLGSKTDRGRKIIKCGACGKKGESGPLGPISIIVVHRGVAKPGDILPGSKNQQRIMITEFCVN